MVYRIVYLGFKYGNLTGIKSADCLRKVKSEMKNGKAGF